MTKLAQEVNFGSLTEYVYPTGTYNADQLGVPDLMLQHSGAGDTDNWAGPIPPSVARPVETAGAVPGIMPWVHSWSDTEDWVFLADGAAVAATRRIQMFKFNRLTSTFSWQGFVTLTLPSAGTQGTYTIRGFRMSYEKYTTGTAAASGTAVTGSGTAWQASRIPVGCRIGFGSTDPTAISTWYEISAIGSDTGITLTAGAGTVADGPYVIEDLRALVLLTNAVTTTNGGLFQAKGLSHDIFSGGGTVIPAATTTDSIRAVYWHTDAATNTNIIGIGIGVDTIASFTEQHVYTLDTLVNPYAFKYNIRAALTPASGKDTNAFVLKTGAGGAVTGAISQVNNGRLVTAAHSTGSGLNCIYFTTATRVYRTADVSTFTGGSTTWLSGGDVMTEVPPGGTATQTAFGTMNCIEYIGSLDKFIICSTAATGGRHYITEYKVDASQFERVLLVDTRQLNQSTASSDAPPMPKTLAVVPHIWVENGIAFMVTTGTTAITNFLYAFPVSADWEYAADTDQRLVLPRVSTTGALNYSKVSVNFQDVMGGTSGYNLGAPTEGLRIYYRTSGITDDSGSWTLVPETGDMDGIAGADYIQFMIEFKTIGITCLPSRVYNVVVTYDDLSTDSHYQPSVGESDLTNKYFAWRFSTAWGSTVPTLRIRLYNALTGFLLNDDDSVTQDGTWEKSTDGGSTWGAYNATDKANDITYIRYTPSSLADNLRVRAMLTEN